MERCRFSYQNGNKTVHYSKNGNPKATVQYHSGIYHTHRKPTENEHIESDFRHRIHGKVREEQGEPHGVSVSGWLDALPTIDLQWKFILIPTLRKRYAYRHR